MKRNLRNILLNIIILSLFILFATIPILFAVEFSTNAQLKHREFDGLKEPASGIDTLYFSDLVREASYLCAWHGGIFFNRKDIVINIQFKAFGVAKTDVYKPRGEWSKFSTEKHELNATMSDSEYKYVVNRSEGYTWEEVGRFRDASDAWKTFELSMQTEQYSGDAYIPSTMSVYGFNADGKREEAKVTSTGYTRYLPQEQHYERNTALAFLLADCEDNAQKRPSASYVNIAFWAHLNDTPTSNQNPYGGTNPNPDPLGLDTESNIIGASNIDSISGNSSSSGLSASDIVEARTATKAVLKDIEAYLKALEEGKKLTDEQCKIIYETAKAELTDDDAYNIYLLKEKYIKDKNNSGYVKEFKKQLEVLIEAMKKNNKADEESTKPKQGAEDFDNMWDKLNKEYDGLYKNTISDKTQQSDVEVEYNATTQKYLVGPFSISYMERYTNEFILSGMAGDVILYVKENDNKVSLSRKDGEWDFVYLKPRSDMIPRGDTIDYGYDNYPHNEEEFYIELNYKDGRNAILGLKFYFKYMQGEALWTRSEGEIENLEWEGSFGLSRCGSKDEEKGHCDGGGYTALETSHGSKATETLEYGYTHYHGEDKENGNHDVSTKCTGATTVYKGCSKKSEDCNDSECKHKHDGKACSECGVDHYVCKGHTCTKGKACIHGFYGEHWSQINLWIEGNYVGSTPIQYIATCHWAWRLYFEVSKEINWDIDLTTSLEGDVWLDIDAQKYGANTKDGDRDSSEHGVKNVLVTVKLYQDGNEVKDAIYHDSTGNPLSWPITTDENGHYHVDRIEAPGVDGGSNCYYVVEFEYDGQVYESTVFLQKNDGDDTAKQYTDAKGQGYFNNSMAVERSPERQNFDNSFSEISGGSPMNSDYSTTGHSPGGDIQYKKSEGKLSAPEGLKLQEEFDKDSNDDLVKSEFISAATEDHKNMKDNWKGSYGRYGLKAYTHYSGEISGGNADDFKIYYPFDDEGKEYGSGDIRYILNNHRGADSITGNNYIDEYMLHINLGLKRRKETDISLLKDLYKMTIIVNEQEVVQNFNCLGPSNEGGTTVVIKDNDDYKTLKSVLEARRKSINKNDVGLYSTDIAYSSKSRYKDAIEEVKKIKENTELRVFATYAIRIYNNSDTNDVTINELTDYYDKTYTLIDNENDGIEGMPSGSDGVYASIVKEDMERTKKLIVDKPYYRILSTADSYNNISWKPTKEENIEGNSRTGTLNWSTSGDAGGMKKSTTDSLKDLKLKVNEYVEIFTTYEIDYGGFDTVRKSTATGERESLIGEKDNIAEVSKYSTYYSERDFQTESGSAINFYKAYGEGQISGKIDKDSAPDNIQTNDIKNIQNYEDDTSRAIPLNIAIESIERNMYGYVFEDNKNKDLAKYSLKVGNGIYDSTEVLIPNVKVSMYEVISLGELDSVENINEIKYNDLEYYYEIPPEFYNLGKGESEVLTLNQKAKNKDGETVDGNYCIDGFLPADYVLRFDYGTRADDKANIYSVNGDGTLNSQNLNIIKYNGQDYENTSFLSETTYTAGGTTSSAINDKYLNLRTEDMKTVHDEPGIKAVTQIDGSKAYSVARDNEARRMVVNAFSRNIENDRGEILRDRLASDTLYVEATQMFAETPIMQIEINQPKDLNEDTNLEDDEKVEVVKTIDNDKVDLINQKYSIKNINFGLEERAKTDIRLEQYIESIFLMKDDDVIFSATLNEDGTVITDHEESKHLDKLTYLTHVEANNTNQQGFYAISVEDDYLNGLSIKIDYRIKIINDSEVDFTGALYKYDTPAKIIDKAAYPPTTEAYTKRIEELLKEEDDTGVATNGTLAEMLKMFGRSSDMGVLSELLDNNKDTTVGVRDTLRPDIIVYGKYLGTYYYENTLNESGKKSIIKQYKWADRPDVEITYQLDKVVETTVDQLIDYIDTNASYDLTTQNYENCAWDLSGNLENNGTRRTIPTLNELVSESSYRTINAVTESGTEQKSNIYDRKGNALVTDVSSNIVIAKNNKLTKFTNTNAVAGEGKSTLSGKDSSERADTYLTSPISKAWVKYREREVKSKDNKALTVGLTPNNYNNATNEGKHEVNVWLTTAKSTASDIDANNMKFDNLVEVLVYSNPTGRRDVYSVPGNAMTLATKGEATHNLEEIGFWKAGYNSKDYWKAKSGESDDTKFKELASSHWTEYPEDDAYAPEFVTIMAPTGITLRDYIRNVIIPITILVIILIIMAGTFGAKQVKIHKRRNDF